MGVMNPCLERAKWEPSRAGFGITPMRLSCCLTMESNLGLQPSQLSGSIDVQPSQKNRVRLVEPNLGGPKEGAAQVSLKVGRSRVV